MSYSTKVWTFSDTMIRLHNVLGAVGNKEQLGQDMRNFGAPEQLVAIQGVLADIARTAQDTVQWFNENRPMIFVGKDGA